MSDFDKYVAQWVSRAGDNLSKEAREQLLTNIHDSLGDYESLRDPKAARARKEAIEKGKQREEEKKKKEEAAKAHEEQTRKRQERQANLPPLPPSKSNADQRGDAPAAGAAAGGSVSDSDAGKPKKKKVGAKKSSTTAAASEQDAAAAANTLNDTTSSRKSRTSQKIPYSKEGAARTSKRGQGGSVQVRDIDFKFGERVDAQLRSIEAEKTPKNAAGGSAGKKKVKLSPEVEMVDPVPPSPPTAPAAAAPVAVSTEDTDAGAAAALSQKSARKRSSPPPLDQVVEEAEKHQEAVEKKQQQQEEGEQAALVATGQSSPTSHEDGPEGDDNNVAESSSNDEESVASFGETKNYQERLNAFHFASVGEDRDGTEEDRSDVMDDDEEEYIDDREDARRRTMQMQRPSRPAISDSTLDIDEARIANFPTTPKSQNKVKTISRVLVRHFLFSTLDDSDIARFASIMDLEKFNPGEKILTKGELNDTFYIILDGEAETTEVNEAGAVVAVPLVRGSTCGDLALMYEVKSEADVTTRTAVQCASIERRTYKMITSRAMEDKRTKYIGFLAAMPLFAGLSPYELERVAETLKEDTYVAGQRVITYGVPNHWLHIVVDGTLRVVYADEEDGKEREVAVITRGQLAGEIEFIYHHLPVASVYAESAVVKTAKLSRRSFELVPSEVRERLVRLVEDDAHYASYHSRMRSASPPAFDKTPHFDAPPASVQKSLRQHESDQSDGTPVMSATPLPHPAE